MTNQTFLTQTGNQQPDFSDVTGTATNAQLANNSLTIGSTNVVLGATALVIAGLTSITATTFTGALTGTSTSATNIAGGGANSIPYQTGAGATAFLATASGVLVGGSTPAYSTTPTLTGTNFTGIPNGGLTNSSVTISPGTGMSGGGAVSLGSSVTLTNAGVTSNVAGTGISVSGATGAVTIGNTGVLSLTQGATAGVTVTASTGAITIDTVQDIRSTASPTFVGLNLGAATNSVSLSDITTSVATNVANKGSDKWNLCGKYWDGSLSQTDTFTMQATYAAGTNPLATWAVTHTGSSGGSNYGLGFDFIVTGNGIVTKYANVTTAGNGMAYIQGTANLTAQAANVAASTVIGSGTTASLYRVSVFIKINQAATTSCTMPDTRIIYTDRDSGAVRTVQVTAGSSVNSTSTYASADVVIDAQAGTNIQYDIGQVTAYASSGATPMQFAYRLRLENLG